MGRHYDMMGYILLCGAIKTIIWKCFTNLSFDQEWKNIHESP